MARLDDFEQTLSIAESSLLFSNKKTSRIELRALKEAFPLKQVEVMKSNEDITESSSLNSVTAYCTGESLDLDKLFKEIKTNKMFVKSSIYYTECLYTSVKFRVSPDKFEKRDIFFFEYGCVVFWGLTQNQEIEMLQVMEKYLSKKYSPNRITKESLKYGIVPDNPMFINDNIYLSSDHYFDKMVISIPIAQSVRLDYYEDYTENITQVVRNLPMEIMNTSMRTIDKQDIMNILSAMYSIRFELNLITSILDQPELLWYYPQYEPLYSQFRRLLEIKPRVDIINHRVDTIQNILSVLNVNYNVKNSDRYMTIIICLLFFILVMFFVVGIKLLFMK
ncbi:Sporulation protein RMD1 [Dictyocoela muelleri]|nr:Sporulation protein RMD1 [Dictyocoela muelleri]